MKFIINSKVLDKLKPKINQAVSYIQQAIESKRPIIIRHHGDVDGYCAGIALERAILPLVSQRHSRERDVFFYYTRANHEPAPAAFYYGLNSA